MFWAGDNPLPVIARWNQSIWKGTVSVWSDKDLPDTSQIRWCIDNKQWSALSDYSRHWAVYNYGGWYVDTDMEILRPDGMHDTGDDWICGMEAPHYVNAAFSAGSRHNKHSLALMSLWEKTIDNRHNLLMPLASAVGPLMQTDYVKTVLGLSDTELSELVHRNVRRNGIQLVREQVAFGIGYQDYIKFSTNVHEDAICRHHWHNSGR